MASGNNCLAFPSYITNPYTYSHVTIQLLFSMFTWWLYPGRRALAPGLEKGESQESFYLPIGCRLPVPYHHTYISSITAVPNNSSHIVNPQGHYILNPLQVSVSATKPADHVPGWSRCSACALRIFFLSLHHALSSPKGTSDCLNSCCWQCGAKWG